jgi:hypothetical protein
LPVIFRQPALVRVLAWIVTPWPVVLFVVFCFYSPGIITSSNVLSYLEVYPPDGLLYRDHVAGDTAFPIVPRAKFCYFDRVWVAKFDHYCPWVARPLGERNYRLFLLFLFANVGIAAVGLIGFHAYIWHIAQQHSAAQRLGAGIVDFAVAFVLTALRKFHLFTAWTMCAAFVFILAGFLCQLAHRVSTGLTTYEALNLRDWRTKHPGVEFVNAYDKGIFGNWKEMICPPVIREHAPYVAPADRE